MKSFDLLALVGLVRAVVPLYGQCGGVNWAGETTCVSGATCVYSNEYYSQCLPGTATTTITAKPTSSTASSNPTGIPAGAITIGNGGRYSTISAALKDTSSNVYYIYAGTYKEQVYIERANVKIYGQTPNKLDYGSNTVTITSGLSAAQAGNNDKSGTVRIGGSATGVALYNLNIANTYGKGTQAIALSVQAGQFGCYACKLTGYQDTLLANKGAQFYGKSYINGATDFVIGQESSIWITKSTIETVASGYITASGRNSDDANYYVIDNSTVSTGSCYLGRPWREYARVVFQNSNLGSNIVAAGWKNWNDDTPNTGHVFYGEYNNSGTGAWNSKRVSFATNMSSPISISTVLGSTGWVDSAYM
ncbi:pectinesterase [Rhizoctonia solani AG-3 Rhs1AP]|uniref:pectinesterase n=2 Tax=Rhizoctonia solani AG-3 TaxID=1086053 RepID=A0A074SDN6_9AGAM|nr:pectinesterase [Rhizoctonia solani AG-3 Rhs1AP]KEP48157.1 pectinesterase [Rhizoctonia solani 123E]